MKSVQCTKKPRPKPGPSSLPPEEFTSAGHCDRCRTLVVGDLYHSSSEHPRLAFTALAVSYDGEDLRQQRTAMIPPLPAQVLAVELENVERIQEGVARPMAAEHGAHAVKLRDAIRRRSPPRRRACLDCRVNTDIVVNDEVWQSARMDRGMLCIGCLEGRLGRRLVRSDFTDAPINRMRRLGRSCRLKGRLRRHVPRAQCSDLFSVSA